MRCALSARSLAQALVAASALLVAASPAGACSCPSQCCNQVWVTPLGDRVPSNVPGFSWWPGPSSLEAGCASAAATADDVRLLRLAADGERTVPLALTGDATGYLARPMEALEVGGRYRFVGGSLCAGTERFGSSARAVTFEVASPAPRPAALGAVAAAAPHVGPLTVRSARGSCSTEVTAAATEVTLQLSPEAQAWAPMFVYETLVDGAPWAQPRSLCDRPEHGASVYGRGRDVVYAVCASDDATVDRSLSPGRHTVRFRATLPGAPGPIESEPVEVDLACSATPGGCHVGRAPRARSAGWLAALAGLLLAAPRRKFRRSA